MIDKFRPSLFKKRRKYHIKRNEFGKSARRCAFDAFDQGLRPAQVMREVDISLATARLYFADWQQHGPGFEPRYRFAKRLLKNHPKFSEDTIAVIGEALDMSVEEVIERLEKPWGLKQLLMGKWSDCAREARQGEAESRLRAGLDIVRSDEFLGVTPKRQREILKAFMDACIEEASRQNDCESDM
jgi:hypothetical protein